MKFQKNHPLIKYNTFGIEVYCDFFTEVKTIAQLREVLISEVAKENKILILGGGSNVLFTEDYKGLVIHNKLNGIDISKETDEDVLVTAGSGEEWHNLVLFAIENNLGGIENLSLIPGSVGAAPIQNIGAYGVELRETMVTLDAIHITSGKQKSFSSNECEFGYRDSIFKNKLRDHYIITKLSLQLQKNPDVNTSYGAISSYLQEEGIIYPTIKDVSKAIIKIRQSKLPDPNIIGNAGSFFKNPVIDKTDYEALKLSFSNISGYFNEANVKIPAAWLIEQCGWKGKRFGNIGVHKNQPLVLVNYGGGTGKEIVDLASKIKLSVIEKFGIDLENEPRII